MRSFPRAASGYLAASATCLATLAHRLEVWAARRTILVAMLIGIGSATAAWLRIPPLARDTLWAEDGRTFLQAALNQGPFLSLFDPYAGYLHTIPRIISSLIVQFVAVPQYAYAMTAATCIVAGFAAGVVYLCSQSVVPWVPARVLLAAVTVLAPLEPREVLGNAANLHSIMFWMLLWMLFYRPKSRHGSLALGIIALLAALTEIQSMFLLPLLLVGLRDRRRWPLRAGFVLGVSIQLAVTLLWPRGWSTNPAVGLPSILYGFLINSVAPLWLPQSSIGPALVAGGPLLTMVLALPVVAAAIFGVRRGTTVQRVAISALAAAAMVVYAASVLDNPNAFYDYASFTRAELQSVWLARYGVVPSMMLIALVVVALSTGLSTGVRPRPAKPLSSGPAVRFPPGWRVATLAAVALLLLVQFVPQSTRRSGGPAWQPQIDSVADTCQGSRDSLVEQLNETIGWKVSIRCGVLEQYG